MSTRSRPGGPPAPLARLNHAPALGAKASGQHTLVRIRRWWYGMNLGRSRWPAWSQELRVQRATLGSASTKVRRRQVLAIAGWGEGRDEREVGKGGPLKVRVKGWVGGEAEWGAVLRTAEGQTGGRGVQVCKSQGQAAAPLTSCPSMVSLCCACQAPTQGPQRQSHCGERSWKQ